MKKSILDLDAFELQNIINSGALPEDVSLEGIEQRDDFEKLYKLHSKPIALARYVLESQSQGKNDILKEKRIDIQKRSLEFKLEKLKGDTERYRDIKAHLTRLEKKVDFQLVLSQEILKKMEETNG